MPGLRNKGNTCYANAALQLLFHCPDFREALLSQSNTSISSTRNADSLQSVNEQKPFGELHKTLLELFYMLSSGKAEVARDPSAVLTLSRPPHFVHGEPQDSAEYLNHLLDCLHEEELKAAASTSSDFRPSSSIVRRLFGGTLSRRTICAACQHVSSAELEDFICLFLPMDSDHSVGADSSRDRDPDLASLVRAHFSRPEQVTDAGDCEVCGNKGSGTRERRLSIRHLSPNVLICLNLFTYDHATQTCHKIMQRVRINEQLSVQIARNPTIVGNHKLADEEDVANEFVLFQLRGMIIHHGLSLGCGHYTCVTRVGPRWVSFDDGTSKFTSLDAVQREQFATPYLLLYSRAF
ncbi:unnamed protein product [Mesocestoides corti]|uniref:ubiquitinyl hydrolase 1 n=1 Tax=Mesocestoides corti TaxID=53468 RepID=A0A3P6HZZ0_MESCO|nr:unnamed protein product [Mesocestoides corti]